MQYWREQRQRILEQIEPEIPDGRKAISDLRNRLDSEFWKQERDLLLALLVGYLADLAKQGVARHAAEVEALSVAVDWTLADTGAGNWARKYAAQLVKGIGETTKQQVRQIIETWYDMEQATMPDLARALEQSFGFSQNRARMIAITETTRASRWGEVLAAEAIEQEGLFEYNKQWNTANDELVCPVCSALHNKVVRGARTTFAEYGYPDEGPPAHPNCRCNVALIPVVD